MCFFLWCKNRSFPNVSSCISTLFGVVVFSVFSFFSVLFLLVQNVSLTFSTFKNPCMIFCSCSLIFYDFPNLYSKSVMVSLIPSRIDCF